MNRTCYSCGTITSINKTHGRQNWYLNHDGENNALCMDCWFHFRGTSAAQKEYMKTYMVSYWKTHEEYRIRNKRNHLIYTRTLRTKLFSVLGLLRCMNPLCAVPGGMTDIRALQIEHINGGGNKEVRERFKGTQQGMVRYYVKHPDEAREKLQIYCANCNVIKEAGKIVK